MKMRAVDTSFQMLPKILKAIHMRITFDVLAVFMADTVMSITLLTKMPVAIQFVGMNRRPLDDVFLDVRHDVGESNARDDLGHYLATPVKHSENDGFVGCTAPAFSAPAVASNVSFVNFDLTKQGKFTVNLGNVFANLMTHAPRTLVRHAKLSFEFFGGYAMPGSGKKVNGVKPELQGCAAILEGRADCGVKVVAAPLAGIGPFRLNLVPVRLALAFRAGMALAKANIKNVLKAGMIRGELLEKIPNGYTRLDLDFLRFHGANVC